MPSKAEQMLRARKEDRQKKLLFVLVPLFLGLAAWQGPKSYHALFASSAAPAPPPAATETAPAPSGPEADPSSAPAPSTAGAGSKSTTNASGLPDTDPRPQPNADQLGSLTLFSSKDPFVQHGESSAPSSAPASESSTSSDAGSSSSGPASSGPAALTAHMTVNGTKVAAGVGDRFPESNPLFRVAALTSTYVKVGLASGSFQDGAKTQKLGIGASITLVKQPEGTPYKLILVSISGG